MRSLDSRWIDWPDVHFHFFFIHYFMRTLSLFCFIHKDLEARSKHNIIHLISPLYSNNINTLFHPSLLA